MPFITLLNAGPPLLFLLLVVSSWGGILASGLVFRRTQRSLRRGAQWSFGLLLSALVLLIGHLALVAQVAGFGWRFGRERLVLAPLLLLPAIMMVWFGLPTLRRLIRQTPADSEAEPTREQRILAVHPGLTHPPRLLALSAGLGIYQAAVVPFLTIPDLATLWVIVAGATLLLWLLPDRAERAINEGYRARLRRRWRLGRFVLVLGVLVGTGAFAMSRSAAASQLPERSSIMNHPAIDLGGGSPVRLIGHMHAAEPAPLGVAPDDGPSARHVTELIGPQDAAPDVRFTLTARQQAIRLQSGRVVQAWAFNGQIPGPELRVQQGDLVEVELFNEDIAAGVTIHWHGVNVPNGEDGVAGVTQDAVPPGGRHVYRFVAEDVGTRWYHSHQQSAEQVRRGLFGALIVEPRDAAPTREVTIIAHGWPTADGVVEAFGIDDQMVRHAMPAGTVVRLRMLNADDRIRTFTLNGAPFRVIALDGNPIHAPTDLRDTSIAIPGGGRADLLFRMPDGPVRLGQLERPWLGMLFSPDGQGELSEPAPPYATARLDILNYGSPQPTAIDPAAPFDRRFVMVFDNTLGFYGGRFGTLRTINGAVHPNTPAQMVREGELIRLVLINRSHVDHPMHLHGHHVLVLSRNGEPVRGSPIWLDTVSVLPGETWEVAFRADNPGIWMDHCHNLEHVATGMMMHLAYEGITTPFEVGSTTGNSPE
jgi:FtsP/CotA-like multicopper oxidase with cupredoxin domain